MQAMMKRILAVFLFTMLLTGCATSGGSPWERRTYTDTAERAPSRLIRDMPAEEEVYTPYQSSGHSAMISTYEQETPGESYPSYSARPPQNDFQARIGGAEPSFYAPPESVPDVRKAPALPPVKVALLLPLTGEHSDIGQAMLQAAQLALFDMGYSSFELMPRDTKGTPQGASQAAQSVLSDGAQIILGPLFSREVRAIQPLVSRHNINMISFSTDWSLAGNNTYIMGILPFAQVQRVAEYAAANGMGRIGILAPNTDYGNAVIAAYNSLAYRTGLNTAEVVRFAADDSDNSAILRNFTRYDERVQALEEQKLALKARLDLDPRNRELQKEMAALEKADTAGEPPFDAVLLPVGGDQARSIANLLSFYDLGPKAVKRLGTGLWDDPGLAAEPALDGAWFAAPSPVQRQGFEGRYRDLFGSRPLRLASLAYDATALTAVLAKNSYSRTGRTSFEREAIVNPNGFAGIDGIFRFRPDGLVERGLAVLEFRKGSIEVIEPAPTTFQRFDY